MRAVVIAAHQVSVAECPDPVPRERDLLVRVEAAGINGADRAQVAGRYPPPEGVDPDIPGLELAGVVESVGAAVSSFAPGDRVMGLVPGAAQAELAIVDERAALRVPEALSSVEAGGFPEVFCTAHDALFRQCELKTSEHVLVSGANGGVGLAAVQLARAAGAKVTATVRDEKRRDEVGAFGAEVVAPEDAHRHGPFDVVIELVGAPNLEADVQALATSGRIVIVGTGAGSRTDIELFALMNRRARLIGTTLRNRPIEEKGIVVKAVGEEVLPLVESRDVVVPVDSTYPLDDVEAAYAHFAKPGKLGKVVLVMRSA